MSIKLEEYTNETSDIFVFRNLSIISIPIQLSKSDRFGRATEKAVH